MYRLPCVSIRHAALEDLDTLRALAAAASYALCGGDYTPIQINTLLRFGLGPDPLLVADGHYYLVEDAGRIVAAGGWSRRVGLMGNARPDFDGDPHRLLDPATDAARLRAFFVHPAVARQGMARMLIALCERTVAAVGFTRLELLATPAGRRLYSACGFADVERMTNIFPNGVAAPIYRMAKPLPTDAPGPVGSLDDHHARRRNSPSRPPSMN